MILEIKNLSKNFGGKLVLDKISFGVEAGECVGIVGRSGCGKSTLAKIIAGLIPADSGEIFIGGELQMIFQAPEDSFDPRKTLGWSIAEPLKNHGAKNIPARVAELLVEVGLNENYASRYPHEVSGGECQRAAIARAISIAPKILICDEATSALDVTVQAQIVALIKNLCAEKNIACLFITHEIAILPKIANKVIVLSGGKIVETGTPAEIIRAPKSPVTEELIAANFFAP